jgi:23S rRNA (cytidine2498-2'-O)-methyltransferase
MVLDWKGRLGMNGNLTNYICITRAGQEGFIDRECEALEPRPQCTELDTGVVELSGFDPRHFTTSPLFFVTQLLPRPEELRAPSVKQWARLLLEQLTQLLGEGNEPWGLHIFEPASADSGKQYSRAKLIEKEILALLKEKRRSLLKSLLPSPTAETTLIQLLLITPERGFISIATPHDRKLAGPAVSPCLAGYVAVPDDQTPPSRAFKKLIEAQDVFGISLRAGMQCADLGASPGGWTHVLAKAGCRVWAIDRSPLDPPLMKNRTVTFVKGDAFAWTPEKTLDLMVCDVISAPEKTLALVERWIKERLCRTLCVTIKFKGEPDFVVLQKVKSVLSTSCYRFAGKQLTNNKNELTVVAWLKN